MLLMALTPFLLFEIAQVSIPAFCVLVGVTTLSTSRTKWRRLIRSGLNGSLKRARWMQLRSDTILLTVQLLALVTACWRVFGHDPVQVYIVQYVTIGTLRTIGAALVAVMTLLNKRDSARLGQIET